MSKKDWFRNKKWNKSISDTFFEKLKSARSQKLQYLVIQSGCLVQKYPTIALKLIDQYFQERTDMFHDNTVYRCQAEAYMILKDVDNAILTFENVLKREKEFPNSRTNTSVEYPYFIAMNKITYQYKSVLKIVNEKDESILIWPVNQFQWHASIAM